MKSKYYTVKYNNGMLHNLDTFDTQQEAVQSAKALHSPDWPVWQGIRVKQAIDNVVVFDSGG